MFPTFQHQPGRAMEKTIIKRRKADAPQLPEKHKADQQFLHLTGFLLVVTVWISAGLFGLYIIAFYATALWGGNLEKWNGVLPGLYQKETVAATASIGLHFATGGIILMLGSIQLIRRIRDLYPALHRWIGRVYVVAAILAAVGGLLFIALKGTVGGSVMNIGFSLYGALMLLAGVQTIRYARAGDMNRHRAWAIRLYALAIGSWLYRMDYGFWLLLTNGYGHLPDFSGGFDKVMAFFFYLPNLLVAEVFIRLGKRRTPPIVNFLTAFVLLLLTGFLVLGTYYFTKMLWGPAIVDLFF
jgi:uncharacterized membrane protein